MSRGGTYTLLIALSTPVRIEIGALGRRDLESGWYAYTGSAFGPGGFARVDRHRELAAGEREVRHWHVDYLLGQEAADVRAAWRTPGEDRECAIGRALPGERIDGVGASDCSCGSHLAYATERATLADALGELHEERVE